jgi:hypothetical protein
MDWQAKTNTSGNNQIPFPRHYRWCLTGVRFICKRSVVGAKYFHSGMFRGVVCVAAGNKMAWHSIGPNYNA